MGVLTGKVAAITGASRGIGCATAKQLAADGAAVVINYLSNSCAALDVVDSIEAMGGSALAVQADISSSDDVKRLFQLVMAHFGRLDILVANAGYCVFSPFAEITEEEFDRTFATNAKGTFYCLQQALSCMGDGGRIICVSTIGTVLNLPGGAAYFASKAAVEQFCRVLAKEVAPRKITVNVVSPGFVDTEMLQASTADDLSAITQMTEMTPLERLGQPQDIANLISFIAGPDAEWITRQNFPIDGGVVSR